MVTSEAIPTPTQNPVRDKLMAQAASTGYLQLAIEDHALAAGQDLGTFLLADLDIAEDLLELFARGLGADHGRGIERMALLDLLHALDRLFHEAVIDRLLDQGAAGAGADFALVEGEHGEPFQRLVEIVVVFRHHVCEEDIG